MKTYTLDFREVDKNSFDAIRSGEKKIESRAATEKYTPIEVGDTLLFSCAGEEFSKTVTKRYYWASPEDMVKEVPLKVIMPWVDTLEEAKAVFTSFPNYEEKIKQFGIVGFELK